MTIFIDVTHTLATGASTGIQRVVRELARRLARDDGTMPVAARNGRFHALDARGRAALDRPAGNFGASRPSDRGVGSTLLAVPALFERVQAWNFDRRIRDALAELTEQVPMRPAPGDVVVLLDAFWGGSSAPAAADAAWRAGARVVPVIYDLIPVTHPQLMEQATVTVFGRRIAKALKHADGIITISHSCAADVRAFTGDRTPPIQVFNLGGDFDAPAPARAPRGPARRFVLVGTVEPRKGHALVLDAFERLWAAGEAVELDFVGRVGWADPALIARCRAHPERGRRFRHHADADDAELAAIVGTADATIVASAAEGFGLPIVESLTRGVPVIASDIPVFREVGGEAVLYFAPGDAGVLEQAVRRFIADPSPWRARAADFEWIGWDASARQFRDAVAAVLADVPAGAR